MDKKEKREKIIDFLVFILIFFYILSIIFLKPINDLDELWNYNFARNIKEGLIPYKDFNIIITPLLSIICGGILKLTFNELIIMRILASFLCSTIFFIIYKLFRKLNFKKEIIIIFVFFIGYLLFDVFCIDYNYATLLLVMLIIYREIIDYQKNNQFLKVEIRDDILLGILAGVSFSIKQTSGLLICISLLGNKLLFAKNKEEVKIFLRSFIYRLIGIIIPVFLLLMYLLFNGAFLEFISYTISGISEFNNIVPYKSLIKLDLIGLLSILVPLIIIYSWIKSVIFEKDKNIYILLVYGLANFIICFPISDKIHFLIGVMPIIIILLYETYNLFIKLYKKVTKYRIIEFIMNFFAAFIILFLICNSFINFRFYYNNRNTYSTLNHYRYIIIDQEVEERIKKIDKYITENKNVKILDASATLYMIPIDRYNKDYDMFNKGNFGKNGEARLIDEIAQSQNTIYLILNDKYSKNWQTPINIINFVKENKIKTGEIDIYDIYE